MAIKLIYETHSITVDNEAGIATGWLPGELSEAGRVEAARLGERRRSGVDVVYSSDLRRAVQTARIAFPGREIRLDARLRECDYGLGNGRPVAELAPLRRAHIRQPWPEGQSYEQVVAATEEFLGELRAQWEGRTVLVVSHSANRWALQHLLEGAPLEELVDAPFAWQPGWEYTLS